MPNLRAELYEAKNKKADLEQKCHALIAQYSVNSSQVQKVLIEIEEADLLISRLQDEYDSND